MKLRSLRLHPFAGIVERDVAFSDGLTVILGPNEAGKTATVNALFASLYEPTKLGKTTRDKAFIQKYFPAAGGSFVQTTLTFEHNGNSCQLQKKWSASPAFHFAYGAKSLDDEHAWDEFIKRQFYPEATARNILFISQMKLSETLLALREDKNSAAGLGEVLRKTVMATDGVSVDVLQKKLDDAVVKYFSHWDAVSNGPEKRRDIDNPWAREAGLLLTAYYEKRRIEESLKSAKTYELRIDELNKQVFALQKQIREAEEFTVVHAAAYKGARERQMKAELIKRIELEQQELKNVQREWPKDEGRLEQLEGSALENNQRSQNLQKELRDAEEFIALREQAEQYKKLELAEAKVCALREGAEAIAKVPGEALREAEKYQHAISLLEAQLEAQKLRVRVTASKSGDLALGQTSDTLEQKSLEQGTTIEAEFSGSLVLQDPQVCVEVFSGNADIEKLLADKRTAHDGLTALLQKYAAGSIKELQAKADAFSKAADELRVTEAAYAALAKGNDIEKLKSAASAILLRSQPRQKEVIRQEADVILKKAGEQESEIRAIKNHIAEWSKKYGSFDNLNDVLGEKRHELKEAEKELASYPPLPTPYTDSASFIKEYENKNIRREKLGNELQKYHVELAALNAQKADKTTEELEEALSDSIRAFELAKKQGEGFLLIRRELEAIRQQYDGNTLEPLRRGISDLFNRITGGKYEIPRMDAYVPDVISGQSGTLQTNLLSTGTLDALALSVRLAMAKELLQGKQGFIIMDDPLINLDPERKRAAAQAITSFAEDGRQVVLFTCDPEHAKLFEVDTTILGAIG